MKKEDYFEELTREENSMQDEFADDIVFARFINYMQIALFHKKLDYDKHQEILKCREQNLNSEEWAELSNIDSLVHSFFCLNPDCDKLETAIDKLTEKQKIVIVNHYYKNQPLNQIAKQLKISDEAVRQLKFRAVLNLKKYMGEWKNE